MKTRILLFGLMLLFFNSCGILKPKTPKSMNTASTNKLLENYRQSLFSESTVQAKIKARYEDPKMSQTLSIKLRIKKDEIIWMSGSFLGIPLAKVKITPTRVQYYEKIKHTYFDGDFSLLSRFLGTDIKFEQLQNMLVGQSLLDLDTQFISEQDGQSLKLTPKNQEALYSIFYWLNPQHFKLDKQALNNTKEKQSLTINYPVYQQIENTYFPKMVIIDAVQPKQSTHIELDYRNVVFNRELRFPFQIPDNYKQIELPK